MKSKKLSIVKQLPDRLYSLRWARGLSREAVSLNTGISITALAAYESGTTEPKISTLLSLCDVYGVTINYLLSLDDTRR